MANEEHKLLFLANPRTASHSVSHVLRSGQGFRDINMPHGRLNDRSIELLEARRGVTYDPDEWESFCVVRNHWDAWVSWYWNSPLSGEPFTVDVFAEIADKFRHIRPHEESLFWHVEDADYIARLENLEEDVNDILGRFGLGPVDMPHRNSTIQRDRRGMHYTSYYDAYTARWVYDTFKSEIEELGYSYAR